MSNGVLNEENKPLIDNFSVPVKIIKLHQWNEICCEKELPNLLTILQDTNKTLDEITHEYKEKFEEKSKTSIHRYLKNYIEKGFIIESGRIIKGKQHTAERLYTNSAKIFFIDNQYLDAWEQGARSLTLASKIGVIAQRKFNNSGFDSEILKNFLQDNESFTQNSAVKVLEQIQKNHPEIVHEIFSLDDDEKLVFFTILKNAFFYLTKGKIQDFKKKLTDIFVEKPLNIDTLMGDLQYEDERYNKLIMTEPSGYQTNYIRQMVHFTDYKNYIKYMLDVNYDSIIIIFNINEYPLTIKEVAEKFPIAYELAYEYYTLQHSQNQSSKENENPEKLPKDLNKNLSENRIYRLIQDLKEDGLVIEAGRQISKDTHKTSILYTTTGRRTIYLENRDEFWKQEEKWRKLVLLIGGIMSFHFGTKNLNEEKFYELFTKIEKIKFDSYKEMMTGIPERKIVNYYHHSLNAIELNSSISPLGTINSFFQKDDIIGLVNELQECFY